MRKPFLNSVTAKIREIELLNTANIPIHFIGRAKEICSIKGKICHKDGIIHSAIVTLFNPIVLLENIRGNINLQSTELLATLNTFLSLQCVVDKARYDGEGYSSILMDNIDDLLVRSSGLYSAVKREFENRYSIKGKEPLPVFTEKEFDLILFRLNLNKYEKYEEITDKILINVIITGFKNRL